MRLSERRGAGELRPWCKTVGDLISGEYDLEGTVDQFSDWRDFFVGSGATAETMADMNRQSR